MQALMLAMPYVSAGAAVVSGLSGIQAANYQSAVASRNAKLMEENAQRTSAAAQADMADQDRAAAGEIASLEAAMSASGLVANSGSMMLRRRGLTSLADRDRERLAVKRDTEVGNMMQEAAGLKAEAAASKSAAKWGWLTTGLGAVSSYLSSATTLEDYQMRRTGFNLARHQQ